MQTRFHDATQVLSHGCENAVEPVGPDRGVKDLDISVKDSVKPRQP